MGKDFLRTFGNTLELSSLLARGFSAEDRAKENARIDLANAERDLTESRRRAFEIQRRGRQAAATQKVRAAGAGFTQEGTSLQVQIDEIEAAEFNALEELRVGQAAAKRSRSSAALNVQRGKVAKRSGIFNALGTTVRQLGSRRERKATEEINA